MGQESRRGQGVEILYTACRPVLLLKLCCPARADGSLPCPVAKIRQVCGVSLRPLAISPRRRSLHPMYGMGLASTSGFWCRSICIILCYPYLISAILRRVLSTHLRCYKGRTSTVQLRHAAPNSVLGSTNVMLSLMLHMRVLRVLLLPSLLLLLCLRPLLLSPLSRLC